MKTNPITWLEAKVQGTPFAFLGQFIRFGLVGVSNTLIQYAIEMLGYYAVFRDTSFEGAASLLRGLGLGGVTGEAVRVVVVTAIGFVISVTNAYYWNSRFVFGDSGKPVRSWAGYFKSVASYGFTGLVLAPVLKLWMQGWGLPYWAVTLLTLIVTIPLNFVLNKLWAFRRRDNTGKEEA